MHHVIHSSLAKSVAVFLAIVASCGCRSGAERDLVQREMRQQEDKIYALEDYLAEYQDLLCDARAENARLKRQSVQGQFRDGNSRSSQGGDDLIPTPPGNPPADPAEEALPMGTPEVTPPAVPDLDMTTPSVPPLGETSDNETVELDDAIQQASAEVEVAEIDEADREVPADEAMNDETTEFAATEVAAEVAEIASAVVLRGEVQLDEESDGPRVLLDVEPVTGDGKPTEFAGRLSILVLDPAAPAKQQQLARWDFDADEIAALAEEVGRDGALEFPLQLPAESPGDRALELWVRLVAEDGAKVLGRTTFDVGRPSRFASADIEAEEPSEQAAQSASAEVLEVPRMPKPAYRFDKAVQQSGWQTAKPGEQAAVVAKNALATSEWKMATRPVPEVVSTPIVESKAVAKPHSQNDRYRTATAPDWSPERPNGKQDKSPRIDHIVPPPGSNDGGVWGPTR